MNVRTLEWDSEFFCKKIARMDVSDDDLSADVSFRLQDLSSSFDLIYVFCPDGYLLPVGSNCELVDRKVVYEGSVQCSDVWNENVFFYDKSIPSKDLYELSLISAHCSRFNDRHFKEGDCERLYRRWMDSSVNGDIADYVLCYSMDDSIIGMVTLNISDNKGIIGLIAVNPRFQSKGVGHDLMVAVNLTLQKKNIEKIRVVTQMDNRQACCFYERHLLNIESVTNIYHYWAI